MKFAIALMLALVITGQMRDNRDKDLTCQEQDHGGPVHRCDIREQTVGAPSRITIDAGHNGGVTVKGWLRNDVLVRSRVDVWADIEADAQSILSQIRVDTSGGTIAARGATTMAGQQGWAVSYEIFDPRISNLEIKAFNGGVQASDVEGMMQLETTNGGIHLARVAGDVNGATKNGGLHIELAGSTWQGRQLELNTTNGGATVSMPAGYLAHVRAKSVHGGIRSEFRWN